MVHHGQRVFMSSAAPYLYQVPGWRPMREYTELALAGNAVRAAEVSGTLESAASRAAEGWEAVRPFGPCRRKH
jgi:hypothetical protein